MTMTIRRRCSVADVLLIQALVVMACVQAARPLVTAQSSQRTTTYNDGSSSSIYNTIVEMTLGLKASKLVMAAEVHPAYIYNTAAPPAAAPADHGHHHILQTSELDGELARGVVVDGFFAGYHSPQFYMEMSVGTPPVPTFFVFDTGSSLSWVQCAEGWNEGAPGTLYNTSLSSSYSRIPCPSPGCSAMSPISKGCNDDGECKFSLQYVDGSFTRGILGLETFVFDRFGLTNIVFGCARQAQMATLAPGRGMMGFGADRTAIPVRMRANIFFCLPLRTLGHVSPTIAAPGVAGLGDLELPERTIFTRLIRHGGHHMVPMEGISIAGSLLPLIDVEFSRSPEVGTIIDTGAYLSYLLPRAYVVVRDAFREAANKRGLRQISIDTSVVPVETCYQLEPGQVPNHENTPSMEFLFEGDVTLSLHPRNVLFRIVPQLDVYCLSFGLPFDANSPESMTMLGNLQLSSVLVSIKTREMTVGFTSGMC